MVFFHAWRDLNLRITSGSGETTAADIGGGDDDDEDDAGGDEEGGGVRMSKMGESS